MLSLCNLRSSDCFTMDRENGRETEAGKTCHHVLHSKIVGWISDSAAQVQFVEIPVRSWSRSDQVSQFAILLGHRRCGYGLRLKNMIRCPPCAPLTHETEQEPRRNSRVSTRLVEGKETIPDRLGVDIPTGKGRLRGSDQLCPRCAVNIGRRIDFYPSGKDSFVLRVSR